MIGISDSVMSLGYRTNMAFNTSVNLKNTQNHCHVDVIHCDRSLYEKVFPTVVKKKLGHDYPTEYLTIIRLRLGEYCRIIPSTSSRGLFDNIHRA